MKLLFYLITLIPISFIRSAVNFYTKLGLHRNSSVYKLTLCNIKICFPEYKDNKKTYTFSFINYKAQSFVVKVSKVRENFLKFLNKNFF